MCDVTHTLKIEAKKGREMNENTHEGAMELEAKVKSWWLDLQKERKCNSTNIISKLVNKSPADVQCKIRQFISREIDLLVSQCYVSPDLASIQTTCNAINGCFDNFVHAADAVNLSFKTVLVFISFAFKQCHSLKSTDDSVKTFVSKTLEAIHGLSRILVLVLKLRRTQLCPKKKNDHESTAVTDHVNDIHITDDLVKLLNQVQLFLMVDDISMDTKNNLAMSGILIREILSPAEDDLIQFHESFVKSLPSILEESNHKLNILKFVVSNAIINTWSVNVLQSHTTASYLSFFINLCESYSSDTPVILSSCRSLLLLVKHNCFKAFINEVGPDQVKSHVEKLLSCIWMLLEHPVTCVRHSARDFLQVLVTYSSLQECIIQSVIKLPKEKRSFFIGLAALANQMGSRLLMKRNPNTPQDLLDAIRDPTIASHVSLSLECVILKDELVESNMTIWCETWIIPLLHSLSTVLPIVAADIEKILEKTFKKHPNAVLYIIDKWGEPKDGKELRNVLTCLKISHKLGHKLKSNLDISADNTVNKKESGDMKHSEDGLKKNTKWKNLIDEKLLYLCLHHGEDDIRISAFSLIIGGHKSTECYTEQDFLMIQHFLYYNLNNQQPATRQKILGLIKKMLVRFSDSQAVLKRDRKNDVQLERLEKLSRYQLFHTWLIEFCFSNIFIGTNFNRLNTVLNILLMCLEIVEMTALLPTSMSQYWNKIVIALESSYEENKKLAVLLSQKLDYKYLAVGEADSLKKLYEKAFDLCTHMEPPDVLTGAYMLLTLLNMPPSKEVLTEILGDKKEDGDVKFLVVLILLGKLQDQIHIAKTNLMKAAMSGPMYGTLFAIRLVFQVVSFSSAPNNDINLYTDEERESLKKWSNVLNLLIEMCFDMTDIVSCVVHSSSPEGHLPMDFQSDFGDLLGGSLARSEETKADQACGGDRQQTETDSGEEADAATQSDDMLSSHTTSCDSHSKLQWDYDKFELAQKNIKSHCEAFVKKYEGVDDIAIESDYDAEEMIKLLKSVLKENMFLIRKVKQVEKGRKQYLDSTEEDDWGHDKCEDPNPCSCSNSLGNLEAYRDRLLEHLKRYEGMQKSRRSATAQVLLLCSWRSIKEACLYLGDLVCKLPIDVAVEIELLSEDTVIRIGEKLRILLCEIKHRGAFEQAYIGFTQVVDALWRCTNKKLNSLPTTWLEEILNQLQSPIQDQTMKFCSTRRSAGLPFMIQAIICTEVQTIKSAVPHSLHDTMKVLLGILEGEAEEITEPRIHALNILRALFKHAQLGEVVAPYVSRALMTAIKGSRASTWSERNSSSLLFSTLIIRIFGVARSRDEISRKNRMTSRTFFQRYVDLYDFLLSEMELVCQKGNSGHVHHPQPSLFLVLLILGRLYPSPTQDVDSIDLSVFLPYIKLSCCNSTMRIRELGARALVPLITHDQLLQHLDQRFAMLSMKKDISNNEKHGLLLQIKALLSETSVVQEPFSRNFSEDKCKQWIESTKWILDLSPKGMKKLPYVIMSSYTQVLHLLFKHCSSLSEIIAALLTEATFMKKLSKMTATGEKNIPGSFLFLQTLHFLKTDVMATMYLNSCNQQRDKFCHFFLSMLKAPVCEVQAIPLSLINFLLLEDKQEDFDEVDTCGAPVKELFCVQNSASMRVLGGIITTNDSIRAHIVRNINDMKNPYFQSKVIHRLWMAVATELLSSGFIVFLHSYDVMLFPGLVDVGFSAKLMTSKDHSLASSGLVSFALFVRDELLQEKGRLTKTDTWLNFIKVLTKHSKPEADIKRRIAIAKILNLCWKLFLDMRVASAPPLMGFWILPLRLMVDDDAAVRQIAMQLVFKLQQYIVSTIPKSKRIIEMESVVSNMTLLPLHAQECLLDCYINIFGKDRMIYLILIMIFGGLSAWDEENWSKIRPLQEELGVFEKGNPNPFCEQLSQTNVICKKLQELERTVGLKGNIVMKFTPLFSVQIDELFWLEATDGGRPSDAFRLIESLSRIINMEFIASPHNDSWKVAQLQIAEIRRALGLLWTHSTDLYYLNLPV